jgi:hypothetical protein
MNGFCVQQRCEDGGMILLPAEYLDNAMAGGADFTADYSCNVA